MTWNVRGLNHPIKRKKVITFIKSKRCDIAFLQETHLLTQESRKLCREWAEHVSALCCVLRKSIDDAGRVLLLLVEIQGHKVILANVYAPNIDDPTFFGQLGCKRYGRLPDPDGG